MSALLQLAERCEKATGPDRELDREISIACGYSKVNALGHTVYTHGKPQGAYNPRFYTASLDAAMQLVPNAYYWSAGTIAQEGYEHYGDMDFGWAQVVHRERSNHIDCEAAATPALAICAAALRARAAS